MKRQTVKKGAYLRKKHYIQPLREKPDDALYDMVESFVDGHSSLALDDSFDRTTLVESMFSFVKKLLEDERTLLLHEVRKAVEEVQKDHI